jgi:DNA-binding GntR family transcriptional regulator
MVSLTRELTMPRVPFVRRIVADVQAHVASGALRPGDKLSTIDEFAEQYGCSTTPVKQAVRILEALGVVEAHPGKGIYVATRAVP